MPYDKPQVLAAPTVELFSYAENDRATLRQMHAIEELARRAVSDPGLLPQTARIIALRLGRSWRLGGLPVGYLGAAVLYGREGEPRAALQTALDDIDRTEREDLLRWLNPPPRAEVPLPVRTFDKQMFFDAVVPPEALGAALASILGLDEPPGLDWIALEGCPATEVWIALLPAHQARLESEGAQRALAAALGTTVYQEAPEDLGDLGPYLLWHATDPDGNRTLVVQTHTASRMEMHPFDAGADPARD